MIIILLIYIYNLFEYIKDRINSRSRFILDLNNNTLVLKQRKRDLGDVLTNKKRIDSTLNIRIDNFEICLSSFY